jgi:phosphoribosyl-dephospho-CoA transferase
MDKQENKRKNELLKKFPDLKSHEAYWLKDILVQEQELNFRGKDKNKLYDLDLIISALNVMNGADNSDVFNDIMMPFIDDILNKKPLEIKLQRRER